MSHERGENYNYTSYTFNGDNTNYFFMRPGLYEVNLSLNGQGNPNSTNDFQWRTETSTNVHFPNSTVSASRAASPSRANEIGRRNGPSGLRTIVEEHESPYSSTSSSHGTSASSDGSVPPPNTPDPRFTSTLLARPPRSVSDSGYLNSTQASQSQKRVSFAPSSSLPYTPENHNAGATRIPTPRPYFM